MMQNAAISNAEARRANRIAELEAAYARVEDDDMPLVNFERMKERFISEDDADIAMVNETFELTNKMAQHELLHKKAMSNEQITKLQTRLQNLHNKQRNAAARTIQTAAKPHYIPVNFEPRYSPQL